MALSVQNLAIGVGLPAAVAAPRALPPRVHLQSCLCLVESARFP